MTDRDFEIIARKRFLDEKDKIAQRLRDLAVAVDQVSAERAGVPRDPSSIIGEVTHTLVWGFANLRLDMLSSWATDVYAAQEDKREGELCGYTVEDPTVVCVLAEGHALPLDDNLMCHVNGAGVMFA